MAFSADLETLDGKLPAITYRWDAETEILSGQFKSSAKKSNGLTGSVELGDPAGAFVILDVASGVVQGLEIVVWPEASIVDGLTPPVTADKARLMYPARPSQPGIAAVEVDTSLSVEKRSDESVIHVRVGPRRKARAVQLADGLILEVDGSGNIAGLWLLSVPPFPKPDA